MKSLRLQKEKLEKRKMCKGHQLDQHLLWESYNEKTKGKGREKFEKMFRYSLNLEKI